MLLDLKLLSAAAIGLPIWYARRRFWPRWLVGLARWDLRASEFAQNRNDITAALVHLQRGADRLEKARALLIGPVGLR